MNLSREERAEFVLNNSLKSANGCLLYNGFRNKAGYGRILIDGKAVGAHRFIFEVSNKTTLSKSMYVLHKCDNPSCVNKDHLFLGDQLENMRDMLSKGRGPKQKQTVCLNGHQFDYVTKSGKRGCRKCQAERVREWRKRNAKKSDSVFHENKAI